MRSAHEEHESDKAHKRWRWLRPHHGCFQNVTFQKVKIFVKNKISFAQEETTGKGLLWLQKIDIRN